MKRLFLLSVALLAIASSTRAQTIKDIDNEEAGLEAIWEKTPLTVHRSVFINGDPAAFGMYIERTPHVFKPGEPILIYAEPIGYRWKDEGDGTFAFGISADVLILNKDKKVIGGKEDVFRKVYRSHVRNKELMLTIHLNLTGAPAGNYVAEYRLHDLMSEQATTAELPFTISAE
jgi:hypothetical protein